MTEQLPSLFNDEPLFPLGDEEPVAEPSAYTNYEAIRATVADAQLGNAPNFEENSELMLRGLEDRKREVLATQKAQRIEEEANSLGRDAARAGDAEGVRNALATLNNNDPERYKDTVIEELVADYVEDQRATNSVEWYLALPETQETFYEENRELMIASQIYEKHVLRPILESSEDQGWFGLIFDWSSFLVPFYENLARGSIDTSDDELHRETLFSIMAAAPEDKVKVAQEWRKKFEDTGVFSSNLVLAKEQAVAGKEGVSTFNKNLKDAFVGIEAATTFLPSVARLLRLGGARTAAAETVTRQVNMPRAVNEATGEPVDADSVLFSEVLPQNLSVRVPGYVPDVPNVSGAVRQNLARIDQATDEFFDGLTDVRRLNPEQETEAVRLARESAARHFLGDPEETFADMAVFREAETDLLRLRLSFGHPGNHTQGFLTEYGAEATAVHMYGLKRGTFEITHAPGGYFISVLKDVAENAPSVQRRGARNIDNISAYSFWGKRWIAGSDEFMDDISQEAAHLTADAYARYSRLMRRVSKEINSAVGGLKFRQRRAFRTLVEASHRRGRWFESADELSEELGRAASDNEVTAYFAYRKLNDLDWYVRNVEARTQKVRNNYEQVSFATRDHGGVTIEGRVLDTPPGGSVAGHTIYDARSGRMITNPTEAFLNRAYENGAVLVQPFSLDELIGAINTPAHLVLVNNVRRAPLDYISIGYRPGGHRLYSGSQFIKQARHIAGVHVKPRTFHVFESRRDALDYAQRLENARQAAVAFRDGRMTGAAASRIVSENVPQYQTVDDFVAAADNGAFSLDEAFEVVRDGEKRLPSQVEGNVRYMGDEDEISSIVDWYHDSGRAWTGRKGEHLLDPQGQRAPILDPVRTTEIALQSAVRIKTFTNYRIKQVDDFAATFGRYMTVKGADDYEVIHPSKYFTDGEWKPDVPLEIRQKGEAFRQSVHRLIGTPTPEGKYTRSVVQNLAEWIDGGASAPVRTRVAKFLYDRRQRDVAGALKSFAFDLKLGLFDPSQLLLQPQAMTAALSIDPVNGLRGFHAYLPLRMAIINGNEGFVRGMAARTWAHGFTEDEFLELYEMITKTGRADIGGSMAYMDNLEQSYELGILSSKVDAARRAGRVFFNEGELLNRIVASAIAYRRIRAANPGVPMSRLAGQFVRESNKFSINMTSASNAVWQKGILSVPTQFLSYQARMIELMMGRQLSFPEKMRLVVGQAAFFGTVGIPASTWIVDNVAAVAGQDIDSERAAEEYWRGAYDSVIFPWLFEDETAFRERAGIGGGRQFVEALYSEPVLKVLAGPALNIAYDLTTDLGQQLSLVKASLDPLSATPDAIKNTLQQNVSSMSRAHKAWLAWKWGVVLNGDGSQRLLEGVGDRNWILQLLGVPLQDVNEFYDTLKFEMDENDRAKEHAKLISAEQIKLHLAQRDGDKKAAIAHAQRISALLRPLVGDPVYWDVLRKSREDVLTAIEKQEVEILIKYGDKR